MFYSEEVSTGTQPETPFDFFDWFLELWRSAGRAGLSGTVQCFLPWMLCFHGDAVRRAMGSYLRVPLCMLASPRPGRWVMAVAVTLSFAL